MPGTFLGTLGILSHLIIIATAGSRDDDYSHCRDRKQRHREVKELALGNKVSKVTKQT